MGINTAPPYAPGGEAPGPDAVYAPNSYIATAGASITIPVEKAFAIWDWWGGGQHPDGVQLDETSAAFTANLSVAVLWEETEEGVITGSPIIESASFNSSSLVASIAKDRTANIYVKVKAGAVGNAVVTLSDATGVRWSWHIWVPKTDPTATTYTHNTGKQTNTFMDRNLGASRNGVVTGDREYTTGMHYQWGRKDPIPAYVNLSGTQTTVPVDISQDLAAIQGGDASKTGLGHAISNPLAFIKNSGNPYDWYSSTQLAWNSRWGDAKDECSNSYTYKSEMDPCPFGWRVPSFSGSANADSPWAKDGTTITSPTDYTGNVFSRGFDFSDKQDYKLGWYPGAGDRDNYGSLGSVGNYGNYWSASPRSSVARYLYFHSGAVTPWSGSYRAIGNSVRCVQE